MPMPTSSQLLPNSFFDLPSIVYVCAPYTHSDPAVREARFHAANRLAARLISEGWVVYSPISHTHPIYEDGSQLGFVDFAPGWQFWQKQDLAMLAACSSVLVYCLDGWEQSVGVRAEVEAAISAGKPVVYLYPEMESIIEQRLLREQKRTQEPKQDQEHERNQKQEQEQEREHERFVVRPGDGGDGVLVSRGNDVGGVDEVVTQ